MCIAPITLETGHLVGCRKCWQCVQRKVDDWVGRNIAESMTAKAAHVVTLTYGPNWRMWEPTWGEPDHPRARMLTYSDVQGTLKRLRNNGYPVRIFSAGEYGSERRRAHWHVIMYWQDRVPEIGELRRNVDWEYWREGHVYWDKPKPAAIRYACKYILKDPGDGEQQGHLMMSKKPPLGAAYFRQVAQQYVTDRLCPQSPFYSFDGVKRAPVKGGPKEKVQFVMTGATLDLFCNTYLDLWEEAYGDKPIPVSPWFEEWYLKQSSTLDLSAIQNKPMAHVPRPNRGDLRAWMRKENIYGDPDKNAFYHAPYVGQPRFVSGQDVNKKWYFIRQKDGTDAWQENVGERGTKLYPPTQADLDQQIAWAAQVLGH